MKTSIYQEFCQRKKLNFPLILYKGKYFVLFKKNNQWRILSVDWRKNDVSPGYFEINYFNINSNTLENNNPDYLLKSFNCSWENYEKYMYDLIKSIKKEKFIIIDSKEIKNYLWQIFISICEKYFIENCDFKVFEQIVISLDKNKSIKFRKRNILNLLNYFSKNHIKIFNFWKYQLTPLTKENNDNIWLKNLFLKL